MISVDVSVPVPVGPVPNETVVPVAALVTEPDVVPVTVSVVVPVAVPVTVPVVVPVAVPDVVLMPVSPETPVILTLVPVDDDVTVGVPVVTRVVAVAGV